MRFIFQNEHIVRAKFVVYLILIGDPAGQLCVGADVVGDQPEAASNQFAASLGRSPAGNPAMAKME